ncbi:carboxymuconolactone decarboxylase family protein [Kitasatospora sp. NPDC048298]|uniref:carboxymuconolactone decarboxylase family protein n=1 Tax=Kitasatospora sp. NPDC048298 TaxID=3364049 RepID=UPI003721A79B
MSPATAPAGPGGTDLSNRTNRTNRTDLTDLTNLTETPLDQAAGRALLADLAGPGAAATLGSLDVLAPGFPDWIVTSLFGGIYQRPGLALRDRQIANLAALTALGGVEPQPADHVRYSRRIGLTEMEITEVMVGLAPYVGLPKALAGLRVAAATFAESTAETAAASYDETAAPENAAETATTNATTAEAEA